MSEPTVGSPVDPSGSSGMPRWLKIGLVVVVILVAVLIVLTLVGAHEPRLRHGP